MMHMPPPQHHVGLIDRLLRAPLLAVVERGRCHRKFRKLAQMRGDRPVHAIGIDLGHLGVLLLVAAFVPNQNSNSHIVSCPCMLLRNSLCNKALYNATRLLRRFRMRFVSRLIFPLSSLLLISAAPPQVAVNKVTFSKDIAP